MPTPITVEICVEDMQGVCAAERGGAARIELCAGLAEGGTTPSRGAIETARELTLLPLVALIRPRPGDFHYQRDEVKVMRRDVLAAGRAGFEGVAVGALTAEGAIDREVLAELIEAARPMRVVFHRAFDLLRDSEAAIDALIELGVDRILSSGGESSAEAGCERLRAHVRRASDSVTLVAAGGVRAHNAQRILQACGVSEIHASAFGDAGSTPQPRIPLGSAEGGGYARRCTSEDVVRALVNAAQAL